MKKLTIALVVLAMVVVMAIPAAGATLNINGVLRGEVTYRQSTGFTGLVRVNLNPTISGPPGAQGGVSFGLRNFVAEWGFHQPHGWTGFTDNFLGVRAQNAFVLINGAYLTDGQDLSTRIGWLGNNIGNVSPFFGTGHLSGVSVTGAEILGSSVALYGIWTQGVANGMNFAAATSTALESGTLDAKIAWDVLAQQPGFAVDLRNYSIQNFTTNVSFLHRLNQTQTWWVDGTMKATEMATFYGRYADNGNYNVQGTFTPQIDMLTDPTIIVGYEQVGGATGIYGEASTKLDSVLAGIRYNQRTNDLTIGAGTGQASLANVINNSAGVMGVRGDGGTHASGYRAFGYGAAYAINNQVLTVAGRVNLAQAASVDGVESFVANAGANIQLGAAPATAIWARVDMHNKFDIAGMQNVQLKSAALFRTGDDFLFGAMAQYTAPNSVLFEASYGMAHWTQNNLQAPAARDLTVTASRQITF